MRFLSRAYRDLGDFAAAHAWDRRLVDAEVARQTRPPLLREL
jgi:hypothetical protein